MKSNQDQHLYPPCSASKKMTLILSIPLIFILMIRLLQILWAFSISNIVFNYTFTCSKFYVIKMAFMIHCTKHKKI